MSQRHERGKAAFPPDERSLGGAHQILADFISLQRRVASAAPTMRDKLHSNAPARSKPLSMAQRLSYNRAVRRAATDPTGVQHISNVYHLNRRIEEAYSHTQRMKDQHDASMHPVYRKRSTNIYTDSLHAGLGAAAAAAKATPQSPPVPMRYGHSHGHQEYRRSGSGGGALPAYNTYTARPSSAPAYRIPQNQVERQSHSTYQQQQGSYMGSGGDDGFGLASTLFANRDAGVDAGRTYRTAGGDAYQGWSVTANLLDAFPGGPGPRRPRDASKSAGGQHRSSGSSLRDNAVSQASSGRGYGHPNRPQADAAVYKKAIVQEIVDGRLYKEVDLRRLFRSYCKLAPLADKDVVEAVVHELKLELDVQ